MAKTKKSAKAALQTPDEATDTQLDALVHGGESKVNGELAKKVFFTFIEGPDYVSVLM